ncbi:TPA: Mu transposase C-terminal domain-containing protein [Pseudomonas aeruginosa]|uniref:Mu transposase C-terminal domain-containing protein n=1 Tax=Pseudomonas aeruginosa TaxID=287 RepID=UPI0012987092|nr:Mu transposase C-terminal domain-containing protein [Pseudomonas aeruginosa]
MVISIISKYWRSADMRKFGNGSEVMRGEAKYRVVSYRPHNSQIRLEDSEGNEHIYSIDDFNAKVARGEYQVSYAESPLPNIPHPKRCLTSLERQQLDRRIELLQVFDAARQGAADAGDARRVLSTYCRTHGYRTPCLRTIQRWKRLEREASGRDGLAPRLSQRGNRSKAFQPSGDPIDEVVQDEIMKRFLATDKFNYSQITLFVNQRCQKYAKEQGLAFRGFSRRTVRRRIKALSYFLVAPGQVDKATFHQEMRSAVKRILVERPYERVEVDATQLDIFCRDQFNNNIGRPTLYAGIDVATSSVVMLVLSIRHPSQDLLLKAFQFAFTDKGHEFHENHRLQQKWPAPAAIETVVLDNAQEHHGDFILSALRYLNITVDYPQAGRPQAKPFIERFFGALKKQLINACPGSTNSQSVLETDSLTKAQKQNLLTIDELETLIIRWAVDVYGQKPSARLEERFGPGCTPAQAMALLKRQYPILPPPSLAEFTSACSIYRKDTRKLRHDGIAFEGFQYHSDELAGLYRRLGKGWHVEIRYNQLDCTVITVVDPQDNQFLIEAYNKNSLVPKHSFADAKAARKKFGLNDAELSAEQYAQNYVELLDELNEKHKSKKQSVRNQAARKRAEMEQVKSLATQLPQSSSAPIVVPRDELLTAAPRRSKRNAQ